MPSSFPLDLDLSVIEVVVGITRLRVQTLTPRVTRRSGFLREESTVGRISRWARMTKKAPMAPLRHRRTTLGNRIPLPTPSPGGQRTKKQSVTLRRKKTLVSCQPPGGATTWQWSSWGHEQGGLTTFCSYFRQSSHSRGWGQIQAKRPTKGADDGLGGEATAGGGVKSTTLGRLSSVIAEPATTRLSRNHGN